MGKRSFADFAEVIGMQTRIGNIRLVGAGQAAYGVVLLVAAICLSASCKAQPGFPEHDEVC